jgi:hypothetical protein
VLLQDVAEAEQLAAEIGFPIMIKATAGGGGRGMRLVQDPADFVKLLNQAKSEAGAAFGNDGCYLEKYITNPRHIEFQVRPPPAPASQPAQPALPALPPTWDAGCARPAALPEPDLTRWRWCRCCVTSTGTPSTWGSATAASSAATRSCSKRRPPPRSPTSSAR